MTSFTKCQPLYYSKVISLTKGRMEIYIISQPLDACRLEKNNQTSKICIKICYERYTNVHRSTLNTF